MHIGIGYDIHALKPGRKLVLGGVTVPFAKGLAGHSDGDALLHALTDAVLGAAGEGDIGDFFPPGEARTKGADSAAFLKKAVALAAKKGLRVGNVDAVVVAEAPKLGAYKLKMRKNVAGILGIPVSSVGLQAKTNEGFDAVGEGRAIACHAVASLVPAKRRGK